MSSVRLGIIGAGAIGRVHTEAAKKVGGEVVAIADVNLTAAQTLAKDFAVPHALGDVKELLARKDIDAVVVALPNSLHKPNAILALEAGKDVLLEKPMAMNVAECVEINRAVTKSGRILQMGFVQRYSTVGVAARQLIQAGRVGKVYHAKANYYRRRGIPGLGGWFTTKSLSGGGPLIDLGVHIIDLMMYLLDFPKVERVSGKVYAVFGPRMKDYVYESMWAGPPKLDGKFDVEDSAHALVRLEGGATFEINTTWAGNFPEGSLPSLMGAFGDKGGLTFQLGGDSVKLATEEDGFNVDLSPALRKLSPFEEQHKEFHKNVRERTQPHASGHCGQVVQEVIEAIYRSSQENREVEIGR